MSDPLHIKEINQSILANSGRSTNSILMVGDAIDHGLGPSEMGFLNAHETSLQIQILNQFKKDFELVETVLTKCPLENPHQQPCYCACSAYRNAAHIFFICDVCKRVPIGKMFVCNLCVPNDVFSCCEECFDKSGHSCKTESVGWLNQPLMRNPGRKGMIAMLKEWENERSKRLEEEAVAVSHDSSRFGLKHLQSGLAVLGLACFAGFLIRKVFI